MLAFQLSTTWRSLATSTRGLATSSWVGDCHDTAENKPNFPAIRDCYTLLPRRCKFSLPLQSLLTLQPAQRASQGETRAAWVPPGQQVRAEPMHSLPALRSRLCTIQSYMQAPLVLW